MKEAGLGGNPGHHVGARFKVNFMIAASIIRNDNDLGRSGLRVIGPLDGESGQGGVGGDEVGDANHSGAGDDGQIHLFGIIGIHPNHNTIDGDVNEGVVTDIKGSGDLTLLQRDRFLR